jgi:crossover junction endodeoxyribonuclease RusA
MTELPRSRRDLGAGAGWEGDVSRVSLTLPLPPSGNRYWRHVGSRVLLSREAREYRAAVRMLSMGAMQGAPPMTGRVRVEIDVHRDLRGDLANHEKQLSDALEGVVFANDSQIWELVMRRHLDRKNPRVEVVVEAVQDT